MARIHDNILTMGITGKLSEQLVFYRRGGKQFVRKAPATRNGSSELQMLRQQKFREAVAYAKAFMSDPLAVEIRTRQLKADQNLYRVLIAEFMNRSNK